MIEQEVIGKIFKNTLDSFLDSFQTFSKRRDLSLSVENEFRDEHPVDYRSEILVFGVDLTLRIQVFYDCKVMTDELEDLFPGARPKQICDFFNETCNLTAGKLKRSLAKNKIITDFSLPVECESSFEKVSAFEVLGNIHYAYGDRGNKFFFCVKQSLEIHNIDSFRSLDLYDKNDDEYEVEFLDG